MTFLNGDNTLAFEHCEWPNYVLSADISTAKSNVYFISIIIHKQNEFYS